MRASDLWRAYDQIGEWPGRFVMRKVHHRREIYPVFRELFAKRGLATGGRSMSARKAITVAEQAAVRGQRLELRDDPADLRQESRKTAERELALDTYPNQIEVITAEQMLDAYSSTGMPLLYNHWSFGKQFLSTS
jgi:hypothetical protein